MIDSFGAEDEVGPVEFAADTQRLRQTRRTAA